MQTHLKFESADLDKADINSLLDLHLKEAHQDACTAALGKDALREKGVTLYAARNYKGLLVGIAGLKLIDLEHGEIKSVRTHPDFLRQKVSTKLMNFLEDTARTKGITRLSLETHPTPAYAAACRLYETLGYIYCGPFGTYEASPKSVFMTKAL